MTNTNRLDWPRPHGRGDGQAAGHPVRVWNRTASKAAPLLDYGATIAGSRQELSKCDVVFTLVSATDDLN